MARRGAFRGIKSWTKGAPVLDQYVMKWVGRCHCQQWTLGCPPFPQKPTQKVKRTLWRLIIALLLISLKCSLSYISGFVKEALSLYNVARNV